MTEENKQEEKEEKGKEQEEVKVPEKFKDIVKEIEKMSVLDLSELVKILEKKFNVSPALAGPVAVAVDKAVSDTGAGESDASEGKSEFNIELQQVGEKKIEVIKVVRDVTGKGLKDAKDVVDAAADSAQMVKENVKKEEAEEIKKKFETAGAKVELK